LKARWAAIAEKTDSKLKHEPLQIA